MSTERIDESYLTVTEVAELLKLNPQTVRNWIDQGSMPAVRVGRRVRIKRSDLEKVIEAGYSNRASRPPRPAPPPEGPTAEDFWGGEPVGTVEGPGTEPSTNDLPEREP